MGREGKGLEGIRKPLGVMEMFHILTEGWFLGIHVLYIKMYRYIRYYIGSYALNRYNSLYANYTR